MKYYKLNNSLNIKEIGKYPQSEKINKLGDLFKIEQKAYKGKINFKWDIPEPTIQKKAKPTTLLKVIPFDSILFLVLKGYFIDFLNNFSIGDYNSWELKVHHKGEVLTDYKLFHLSYPSDKKCINFQKSSFLIGHIEDWKDESVRKPIDISSYENYLSLEEVLSESDKNARIRCDKLVLDFTKINDDIIRLVDSPFGIGYFVSEKLKDEIEKERFTGMEFIEVGSIDKRIEVIY